MAGPAQMKVYVCSLAILSFIVWKWVVPGLVTSFMTVNYLMSSINVTVADGYDGGASPVVDVQRVVLRDFVGTFHVRVHTDTAEGPVTSGCSRIYTDRIYAGSPPPSDLRLNDLAGPGCDPPPGTYVMSISATVPTSGVLWALTGAEVRYRLVSNAFTIRGGFH